MELHKKKDDIVSVLFWVNVIFFIFSIFFTNKAFFISVIVTNLLFLGTFMVVNKYYFIFETLSQTNKFAKSMKEQLNRFS